MKSYNKLDKNDKEDIIKLFQDGKEVKEIPNILNISERGVSRVLKEAGINTKCRNRYSVNEDYFEVIDTQEKAYILGLFYADGFVGNEKFNNIVLQLKDTEYDLLMKIKTCLGFTGDLRFTVATGYSKTSKNYVLNFSSKKMANDLRKLGLYPGKSATMETLPDIPQRLIRHFIRGYFDGDGSVNYSISASHHKLSDGQVKVYKYCSPCIQIIATEKFADNLIDILPVKFTKLDCKSDNMIYIRTHCREYFVEMYDYFYNDSTIFMQRKFDKFNDIIGALGKELSS